jgi:hypothetical protein
MLLGRGVEAPVDVLDEELEGLQAFGSMMVVPGGESQQASFRYRLPQAILETNGHQMSYRLRIAKQPGTRAIPIAIRIQLPGGTALRSSSLEAVIDGNQLYYEASLRTDLEWEIEFWLE